ncbi:VWA domain-containing protein [Maricaulis sp.]|uniref:vWA domain-containing protein n=1 Tax=Maricaulis sp. TaxID=1486257 RepID=UPI0025C27E96|nr:VWA domain-containing protein [Maricaulis sp.]
MKRVLLISAAGLALLAACTTTVAPPPPLSPPPPAPPPPPPPPAMAEMVTVTGSRVRSAAYGSDAIAGVSNLTMPDQPVIDRERYEDVDPNPVVSTADEPVSTFSIDVDTASYSLVRNSLENGQLPPTDAVRIEEMVNYFDYDYALPPGPEAPFATHVTVTPTPWNAGTQLLHIGIQGYEIIAEERPRANLVFLVDVSGSMNDPDKLPLAIQAMHMLVDELHPEDTVALVVYAGAAGAVLPPTEARDARTIHRALDRLSAGGSTAGGAGLALAYDLAEQNFDADAVNRVMLLTDGDFNVGVTQDERLEDFVARKRDSGIYLSVMGFGRGNYNDQMMQTIAQAGNGTAAYIDSRQEARRMLVEESFSALFPIAEDVKIQIEFNPARVAEYRLIGYETRLLDRADFNNDAVDAGEVGSGHSVTAIYEIAAPGSEGVLMEPLRYGGGAAVEPDLDGEFGFLRLRYKRPGEDDSRLIERPVTDADRVMDFEDAPQEARFSIAVAGFAQRLRGDAYLGDEYDWAAIRETAAGAMGADAFGYRAEFLDLVSQAEAADAARFKP